MIEFNDVIPEGMPETTWQTYAATWALIGISFVLSTEVLVLIFIQFKRYRGLYFWSLMVTVLGLLIRSLGNSFRYGASTVLADAALWLIVVGITGHVIGQMAILYSRLHIVYWNPTVLRCVFITILLQAIFFILPMYFMQPLVNGNTSIESPAWEEAVGSYENAQKIAWVIEENILALFYVWATVRLLRTNLRVKIRRIMWELLGMSVFVFVVDILWLVLFFERQIGITNGVQLAAYAIKLRLEFAILNQLLRATQAPTPSGSHRYMYERGRPANQPSGSSAEQQQPQTHSVVRGGHRNAQSTSLRAEEAPRQLATTEEKPDTHANRLNLATLDTGSTVANGIPQSYNGRPQVSQPPAQHANIFQRAWRSIPTGEESERVADEEQSMGPWPINEGSMAGSNHCDTGSPKS
jgi:hypothetical protein